MEEESSGRKPETRGPRSSYFDANNDWSFAGIPADPTTPSRNERIPVYRDGALVSGQEPPG